MKIIQGNLIESIKKVHFDIVIHGCNCFHVMGAGIAGQLAKNFPGVVTADLQTKKGDEKKLGQMSISSVMDWVMIVNLYTQFYPGKDLRLESLREGFRNVKRLFGGKGLRIAYPKIGAGIAGGDWNEISRIIDDELEGEDHTLVEYVNHKAMNNYYDCLIDVM